MENKTDINNLKTPNIDNSIRVIKNENEKSPVESEKKIKRPEDGSVKDSLKVQSKLMRNFSINPDNLEHIR
jgi:hypothetical protein